MAAAGMGAGKTLAYFTDTDRETNTFSTGGLAVELTEPEWNPGEEGDGKNLYPGYTAYKNPTVGNTADSGKGTQPCYVRMCVGILDREGRAVTDPEALKMIYKTIYYDAAFEKAREGRAAGAGLIEGHVPGYSIRELAAYPMVNPQWQKDTLRSVPARLVFNYMGEDGDGIMEIGEKSALFTSFVIPVDWSRRQLEEIGDFQLEITSQAIQCQSFVTPQEAWKALDAEEQKAWEFTAFGEKKG